jgi:hypothetical protein
LRLELQKTAAHWKFGPVGDDVTMPMSPPPLLNSQIQRDGIGERFVFND